MHGIDVETAGHEGGGALKVEEGRLRLVQLSDELKTYVYDAFRQDHDVIRRAIEARNELVAHNAKFERMWLKHALGVDLRDLDDTMVMSQVYYTGTRAATRSSFSHSLLNVAQRELKEEIDKEQQTSDWGAAALTREQLEYAAKDAKIMPKLAEALMRKVKRARLEKVYELELRVAPAVAAMEDRGVAIHTDQLDAEECGHEVLVANARKLRLIYSNKRKTDEIDAENLARLARVDPKLLYPLRHRGEESQAHMALIRSREALVSSRTQLVNHVRGGARPSIRHEPCRLDPQAHARPKGCRRVVWCS